MAPATQAAEGAAKAAGAAAASAATKVGSVTAGLGKAVPLGSLSVPASWTSATAPTAPGVAGVTNATTIPAALEAGPAGAVGNTPVAPPFGQFINGGNGRKTPAYGHRLTFMTRPPAAG
jgi:PPE-SVP subfamily C-terminal region